MSHENVAASKFRGGEEKSWGYTRREEGGAGELLEWFDEQKNRCGGVTMNKIFWFK